MNQGLKTIIVPVKDIAKARKLYGELLGVEPTMDQPYYVGFDLEGQHVGLDPNGHSQGLTGPVGYWHVDDIKKSLDLLLSAGAHTVQDLKDVGGGKLIASVKDADGNIMGLLQSP